MPNSLFLASLPTKRGTNDLVDRAIHRSGEPTEAQKASLCVPRLGARQAMATPAGAFFVIPLPHLRQQDLRRRTPYLPPPLNIGPPLPPRPVPCILQFAKVKAKEVLGQLKGPCYRIWYSRRTNEHLSTEDRQRRKVPLAS